MPSLSWEKLQSLAAQVGERLPGTWALSEPPPHWLAILTRNDSRVRILIDDRLTIVVNASSDDRPLPPLGTLPSDSRHPFVHHMFKTRHRDPEKISSMLARRLGLG